MGILLNLPHGTKKTKQVMKKLTKSKKDASGHKVRGVSPES